MNARELLDYLKGNDVELWKDNGNIRFSAPKNVMNGDLLGELSAKKAEILTLLEEPESREKSEQTRACPEGRNQPFPLTEVQQAYWIGRNNVYDLGGVSCHNYIEVDCPDLDIPRLALAWKQIVRRHEMLRAVIREDGQQVVLNDVPDYEIRTIDASNAAVEDAEATVLGVREEMSHQVMDVAAWPLFDIRAVKCPGSKTRLHLTFEYLVADAWSINIFIKEWIQLYYEPEHAFTPLEYSFREYVLHGERLKKSKEHTAAFEYWKKRLPTLPAGPDLPLKASSGGLEKNTFTRLSSALEKPLWQALKQLGKKKKITPSAILLTAFSQILSTWSKKPNFCINLTLFNRLPVHPQVNDIVGDFTSLNLLEVDASLPGTFEDHAHRLQKQLWADMEHRSVGGVQVLRELARERKDGEQIFMPVVFTSVLGYDTLEENNASAYSRLGKIVYNITQTPQVWIDHQVTESNGALQFNWDVVEGLFPQGMIQEMFAAYCRYLKQLVQESLFSAAVPLLTPESHLAVRRRVNRTEAARPEATLHGLFSDMVDQARDRPAVVASDRAVTYGELDAISSQLAGFLTGKGVKKGSLVAVVMEKGWEQVAAVLGILKAGAVYLPVSPGLPEERMAHILEHGGVALALTRSADGNLALPSSVAVASVDSPEIQAYPSHFSGVDVLPEDLAYIIYTSGSTGLPKGVMIDHKGAVNTILDINARFAVTPADRVLALSSLSFDLSVYDIFGTLAAGATLVMPVAEELKDPSYLAELVAKERVTVWNSVPALLEMVVDYVASAPDMDISSIRLALLSGSWIPLDLAEKVRMKAPGAEVVSLGGATEASIWSIFHPIGSLDASWESVPYGTPLENQNLRILDQGLKDRPDWVVGQIHIGGMGLAQGYFNDPEKTASAFIVHPETGERLYKTGDMGRYRQDGTIELLGREDNQVKIRGYRVELGEIEAAIKSHPAAKEAVVAAVGGIRENKKLVGFVQVAAEHSEDFYDISTADATEACQAMAALVQSANAQAFYSSEIGDLDTTTSFMALLEELAFQYVCKGFMTMNLFVDATEGLSRDDMILRSGLDLRHEKLFKRQIDLLLERGVFEEMDGLIFQANSFVPGDAINSLWQDVDNFLKWIPQNREEIHIWLSYIRSCGENLVGLFQGSVDPLNIFFPDGSWETAETTYQLNLVSQHYNAVYGSIMAYLSQNWNKERPLRILEVGAGVGSASASILPVLNPDNTVYNYTDISNFFTNEAKVKFKEFAFIEYGILDINQDPFIQGYSPDSFDVILANGVLHNAYNMESTVQYLQSLLAPGGYALIFEPVKDTNQLMITMSFLAGLSNFEDDYRIKRNSPFLHKEKWREVLLGNGFERVEYVGAPAASFEIFGVELMIAQGATRKKLFNPAVITEHLRKKLPEYMVPSLFMPVKEFPLTATGKLDRKALLHKLGDLNLDRRQKYAAPRNSLEKQIAAIWESLLGMESIGINDNFFELGGDSLLVSQMLVRLREQLAPSIHWEPVIRNLVEFPTIAGMVESIQHNQDIRQGANSPVVRLKENGRLTPFFCFHDGTGNLSVYSRLPNYIEADRPLYALKIVDAEEYTDIAKEQLVERWAAKYLEEITSIQPEGPYFLGGFCMGGLFSWEVAQQLWQRGQEVKALVLISSSHTPFMIDDDSMILELFSWIYRFSLQPNGVDLKTGDRLAGFMKLLAQHSPDVVNPEFVNKLFAENFSLDDTQWPELSRKAYAIAREESLAFGEDSTFEDFERAFKIFRHSSLSLPLYKVRPYGGSVHLFKPKMAEYACLYGKRDMSEYFGGLAEDFHLHEIPGNHLTCMEEPNIRILASKLNSVLS